MKEADMEVTLLGHYGSDLEVVNAARVSFHKEVEVLEAKDEKLIQYLADHAHFSPFNHAFLSFRVKAPIFVARQLVKHKFLPWNEVSRRYVDEEPEFYLPGKGMWREKADNVKQGSGQVGAKLKPLFDGHEDLWGDYDNEFDPDIHVNLYTHNMLGLYKDLIKSGICPEQARMVLPQNTMTEWIWSGTLGAWLDMLKLRLDPHTQQETREVAQMIAVYVHKYFPISYAARIK